MSGPVGFLTPTPAPPGKNLSIAAHPSSFSMNHQKGGCNVTNALPRKLHCRNVITLLLLGAAALRPPSVTAGGTSLLADLQYRAWRYFEENVSSNGLIRDHLSDPTLTSAEAAGFYLTAICVAERNGWIPREEAAARTRACLEAYAHLPRFHGFLAHYYDIGTGEVVPLVHEKDDGADALQTALFIAGALTARAWFDRGTEDECRNSPPACTMRWNGTSCCCPPIPDRPAVF